MRSDSGLAPTYSAKLLSPFRYPGGKTWLVPLICQWLDGMEPKPSEFIEPFGGGCIVGLNVAFKGLSKHVTLVELDEDVASVWKTIITKDAKRLAGKIATFDFTLDSVNEVLSKIPHSLEERAFQTILRNRINRAGILASGAGMLKNGEDGKGIKSRWYPETLKRRILEIDRMQERVTFIEGDGLTVLRRNANRGVEVVFFIDPPYTAGGKQAGRRLYKHHKLDHEELFRIASTLTGDFLMTYSNDGSVHELARQHNFQTQEITMRSSHHTEMTELLIGRDLDWIRRLENA